VLLAVLTIILTHLGE